VGGTLWHCRRHPLACPHAPTTEPRTTHTSTNARSATHTCAVSAVATSRAGQHRVRRRARTVGQRYRSRRCRCRAAPQSSSLRRHAGEDAAPHAHPNADSSPSVTPALRGHALADVVADGANDQVAAQDAVAVADEREDAEEQPLQLATRCERADARPGLSQVCTSGGGGMPVIACASRHWPAVAAAAVATAARVSTATLRQGNSGLRDAQAAVCRYQRQGGARAVCKRLAPAASWARDAPVHG